MRLKQKKTLINIIYIIHLYSHNLYIQVPFKKLYISSKYNFCYLKN